LGWGGTVSKTVGEVKSNLKKSGLHKSIATKKKKTWGNSKPNKKQKRKTVCGQNRTPWTAAKARGVHVKSPGTTWSQHIGWGGEKSVLENVFVHRGDGKHFMKERTPEGGEPNRVDKGPHVALNGKSKEGKVLVKSRARVESYSARLYCEGAKTQPYATKKKL